MRRLFALILVQAMIATTSIAFGALPTAAYNLNDCTNINDRNGGAKLFDNDDWTGANRTLCMGSNETEKVDEKLGDWEGKVEPWGIGGFNNKTESVKIRDEGGDGCDTLLEAWADLFRVNYLWGIFNLSGGSNDTESFNSSADNDIESIRVRKVNC